VIVCHRNDIEARIAQIAQRIGGSQKLRFAETAKRSDGTFKITERNIGSRYLSAPPGRDTGQRRNTAPQQNISSGNDDKRARHTAGGQSADEGTQQKPFPRKNVPAPERSLPQCL
jgi:hypothetical protein